MSTVRTDNLSTTDSLYTVTVQQLASLGGITNPSDPTKGAALIGRGAQFINTLTELRALSKTAVSVVAYLKGSGMYYLDLADVTSADNGGTIIVATDGGRWKLSQAVQGITPEQFGAKGDFNPVGFTGTDDSAAFNSMLTWVKTQVNNDGFGQPNFTKFAIFLRPGAIYRVDSSLNMTGMRSRGVHLFGNGATLYAKSNNNTPVIDAIYSRGLYFHDLQIYAENGATSGSLVQPSYGIVIGRKDSADGSEHHFENVNIRGWYNRACMMNISGELISYSKCNFENNVVASSDYTGISMHITDSNEASYSSAFQTMGTLPLFGMNEQLYSQCNFNSNQGVAIRINGVTRSCKFHQCYAAVANAFPGVRVKGDHYKLELDIHVEASNATANVEFDLQTNNVNLRGFRLRDHAPHTKDLMSIRSGIGSINITNGEIEVDGWDGSNVATAKLAATGSAVNFHGIVKLGSTNASQYNLTGFNSFRGEMHTASASTALTNIPGSGHVWVRSVAEASPVLFGASGLSGRAVSAWQVGELRDTNGTKVVGTQNTGWTAGTGTPNKGAFAADTATAAQAAQRVLAIEQALRAHGLIN